MRRTLIIAAVLGIPVVITVVLIVVAATSKKPTGIKPVTLKLWGVVDTPETMKDVLGLYHSVRQNVKVEYTKKDFATYRQDLLDALASGSAPDLFQIPAAWMTEYAAKGRVKPLPKSYTLPEYVTKRQLFKKVTTVVSKAQNLVTIAELQRNFVPSVAEDSVVEAQIVGMPFAVDTLALFSNRQLLDFAQLTAAPKTWDALATAAPKLTTADAQGNFLQSAIALGTPENTPHAVDILSGLMVQGGATLIDAGSKSALFNNESGEEDYNPGLAATELYTSFAQPGKETYAWNAKQGDAFSAFTAGRVALYLGYQFEWERIKAAAPQLAIDVNPMLHLREDGTDRYSCSTGGICRPYNIAGNWTTAVAKQSTHPNEAWDLIQFIARRDDVQRIYAKATKRTPVLKSALEKSKTGGPEDAWIEQAFTAHSWYHGNDAAAAERSFQGLISSVLDGSATAREALDLAAKQVTATLR